MSTKVLTFLILCFTSAAFAEDFKTANGKEYKKATVTGVEPDRVTVNFSGGLVKTPFSELSKELQDKYHSILLHFEHHFHLDQLNQRAILFRIESF